MAVQFFLGPNDTLVRVDSMLLVPEVFFANRQQWAPNPDLDTLHDVTAISRDQALAAPGMTGQLLDAAAT
jgi:hypothetical protein